MTSRAPDGVITVRTRVLFAIAALVAFSAVAYFSFRGGDQTPPPRVLVAEAPVQAAPETPIAEPSPTPPAPPPEPNSAIPYRDLTKTAATRNEVIYTVSAMGEPMEVHPDGTVVIHNHKKVFTFADGRQEVRYARITAKPGWIPLSGLQIPAEDATASK
jgi:hypothetical protein